jgi:hypothetical protein
LKLTLVFDSVSDDVDLDVGVWKAVVAIEPFEPFLVLLVIDFGDFGSLCLGESGSRVPSNTDVEVSISQSALHVRGQSKS